MKPVSTFSINFKNSTIEVVWFWGWFKDLFSFRRREYDGKLFSLRRFSYWNSNTQEEQYRSLHIWPLNLSYYKTKFKPGLKKENTMLWFLKQFGLPMLIQAVTELLSSTVKNPTSPEAIKLRSYVSMLKVVVDGFLEKTGGNQI